MRNKVRKKHEKRWMSVFLTVVLCLTTLFTGPGSVALADQAGDAVNVVTNPSFEEVSETDDGKLQPDIWRGVEEEWGLTDPPWGLTLEASTEGAHSGTYSAYISETTNWGGMSQRLYSYGTANEGFAFGETYEFHAWIKLADGSEDTTVEFVTAYNNETDNKDVIVSQTISAGEWQELTGQITLRESSGIDVVYLQLLTKTNGTAFYLDDVALVKTADSEDGEDGGDEDDGTTPDVSTGADEDWNWRNVELNGMGWVTGLVAAEYDETDATGEKAGQIYAKTDVGGVYRYDRSQSRWIAVTDSLGLDDRSAFSVDGLAVDPHNGNTVYFAGNGTDGRGEVYKSTDAGTTWTKTGLSQEKVYMGGNDDYRSDTGERLAVDPNNSDVIYYGSRKDGLWKKAGEESWVKVDGGLPQETGTLEGQNSPAGYSFVAFDENSGTVTVDGREVTRVFYVGVYGYEQNALTEKNGVYKTADGGQTFQQMSLEGEYDLAPQRGTVNEHGVLAVTSYPSGTGYLLTAKRDDPALTLAQSETGYNISGIDVSPDGTTFVAMTNTVEGYLYTSGDDGVTWTKTRMQRGKQIPYQNTSWCHTERGEFIFDPADQTGRTGFAGTGFGVVKCTDLTADTTVWDDNTEGIGELVVNLMLTTPLEGGYDLHTGVWDMGGFSIQDRYEVPTERLIGTVGEGAPEWGTPLTSVTGMDYCYSQPEYMVYTGYHEFAYYTDFAWKFGISKDGGQTWKEISTPKQEGETSRTSAGAIAMSSENPEQLVWSPVGGFLQYSTDMGTTWQQAEITRLDGSNLNEVTNKVSVNDASAKTYYERTGTFWGYTQNLAADRVNGNTFYFFTETNDSSAEFYMSTDGGKTWKQTYQGVSGSSSPSPDSDEVDSTALPFTNVRVNPVREGDVFLAVKGGFEGEDSERPTTYMPLWRSTDKSCTDFEKVPNVQAAYDVAFGKGDSDDTPYIYIFGKANGDAASGVYVSRDDGNTWIRLTDDNHQFGNARALAADMRYKNRVYVGTSGRGIICGEFAGLPEVAITGLDTDEANIIDASEAMYKVGTTEVQVSVEAGTGTDAPLQKICLYNGGTLLEEKSVSGTEESVTFQISNSEGLAIGQYLLTAKAVNSAGNEQTSSPVYFRIGEKAADVEVVEGNLIEDPSFENGVNSWFGFGGALESQREIVHAGESAASYSSRSAFWDAVAQNIYIKGIKEQLEFGETYDVSAWLRLPEDTEDSSIQIQINYSYSGDNPDTAEIEDEYQLQDTVLVGTAKAGVWTELSGKIQIREASENLEMVQIQFMEPYPGTSPSIAFYLDDVVMVKSDGTVLEKKPAAGYELISGGDFEGENAASWEGFASWSAGGATEEAKHSGENAFALNTGYAWGGGQYYLEADKISTGTDYDVSVWAMAPETTAETQLELFVEIEYTEDSGKETQQYPISTETLTQGEWKELAGTMTFTEEALEEAAFVKLVVKEAWTEIHNENGGESTFATLYLDDTFVTAQVKGDAVLKVPYGSPSMDLHVLDAAWEEAAVLSPKLKTGETDVTAQVKLLWDENYLYVLATVKDSVLNESGSESYDMDSIEIFKDEKYDRAGAYGTDDSQYRIDYQNTASFSGAFCSADYLESNAAVTDEGYQIAAKIAYTHIIPYDGGMMGLDIQVNDGAGGTRVAMLNWADGTGNGWLSTENFGTLLFVDTLESDSGDTDPDDTDQGNTDPEDPDQGDTDPDDAKPGDPDQGNTKPGDTDSGTTKPGDTDSDTTVPGDTGADDTAATGEGSNVIWLLIGLVVSSALAILLAWKKDCLTGK